MEQPIVLAFALATLAGVLVGSRELRDRHPDWHWYLTGYIPAALRVLLTWRKVARLNDLAVSYGSNRRVVGGLTVKGTPVVLRVPRLKGVRPLPNGLAVRVRLLPGQTPAPFIESAEAMAHAWHMFAVRVVSPRRGVVLITATAGDPLKDPRPVSTTAVPPLLSAVVGALETGGDWSLSYGWPCSTPCAWPKAGGLGCWRHSPVKGLRRKPLPELETNPCKQCGA